MKQSLKDLALAGGIPLEKVQGLIDLVGDETWIESILMNATKSEKAAMLAGVAYKADDAGGELDEIDQAYVALRDAIEAGDPDGVQQALGQLAELAQSSPPPSSTPKARVLSDQGDQSVFPSTQKAYIDPLLAQLIGDRSTTKAFDVRTDFFARALGAGQ